MLDQSKITQYATENGEANSFQQTYSLLLFIVSFFAVTVRCFFFLFSFQMNKMFLFGNTEQQQKYNRNIVFVV